MRSVRIEPVLGGKGVNVDIVCDCGQNGLRDKDGVPSFKHYVPCSAGSPDVTLVCVCKKKYLLHPQDGHIHITDVEVTSA